MHKIGIIGSGAVAQALSKGFKAKGWEVRVGTRQPDKLAGFAKETGIAVATFAEAADFGEILVFAVKGSAAEAAIAQIGPAHLAGKTVIDTTNPIADAPPVNGVLTYFTGANESLMERLQKAAPQARFVKAWNSIGAALMVDPKFPGGKPTMFFCGNDEAAKAEVAAILRDFGWDVEDVGKAEGARPLEALCQLWCAPGFLRNDWTHAFRQLRM